MSSGWGRFHQGASTPAPCPCLLRPLPPPAPASSVPCTQTDWEWSPSLLWTRLLWAADRDLSSHAGLCRSRWFFLSLASVFSETVLCCLPFHPSLGPSPRAFGVHVCLACFSRSCHWEDPGTWYAFAFHDDASDDDDGDRDWLWMLLCFNFFYLLDVLKTVPFSLSLLSPWP